MNQKIAPSAALCVGPLASAGMLPVPAPVGPWHAAHWRANKLAPPCAATRLPANGFFVCSAAAGAPWKEAVCALTGKHTPIAAIKNADRDPKNTDLLLIQLVLRAAFKLPSHGIDRLKVSTFQLLFRRPDAQHSTSSIREFKKSSDVCAVRCALSSRGCPVAASCCVWNVNRPESANRARKRVFWRQFRVALCY